MLDCNRAADNVDSDLRTVGDRHTVDGDARGPFVVLSGLADSNRRLVASKTYAFTVTFGTQCLVARRLVESGARFIEVTCPNVGHDRWDQHSKLKQGHEDNARATDQPVAALLTDLKRRGMLDDTLVVWGGEFGRTSYSQGRLTATNYGRDHHPRCFTMWLAGGGIKGGTIYGATDDFSYNIIEDPCHIRDFHATILHLLGIDHEKLTFRFQGRDYRLTDVHGHVVKGLLG